MKYYFVVNPVSGVGNGVKNVKKLVENLDSSVDYEVICTERPHHATQITQLIGQKGEDATVFACGGDGTLYDVVNGAVGFENLRVGIIPFGSGNDYVKSYGTKEQFQNISDQLSGEFIDVDLIKCGDRYCINIASIGLDAFVVQTKSKLGLISKISGKIAYFLAVFITFIFNMGQKFKVQFDDEEPFEQKLLFVVAANGKYYGGGFNPTPNASTTDGYIHSMLIDKISRIRAIPLVMIYRKGKHTDLDICKMRKVKKLTVESEVEIPINLDGELFLSKTAEFEIMNKALKLHLPKAIFSEIVKTKEKDAVKI